MIPVMIGLFAMTVAMWMDDTGVLDDQFDTKVRCTSCFGIVCRFLLLDEG